jgi:hypothetical protein
VRQETFLSSPEDLLEGDELVGLRVRTGILSQLGRKWRLVSSW